MSAEQRTVIRLFMASPGDLGMERQIARDVISRLNTHLGRNINYQIDLLAWEDAIPGAKRPQDIINKDIDNCDVFVGMLWHRWGEPSGKYSSGFEEEFSRAKSRAEKTGFPEIWLFLKHIEERSAQDPGPQLKKVIKFRDEQRKAKEVFYKEFNDENDWQKEFINCLLYYYGTKLRMISEVRLSAQEVPLQLPRQEKLEDIKPKRPYPEELLGVIDIVSRKMLQQESIQLDQKQISRLHLLASSWFASSHPWRLLDVHESNLFYARKDNLLLTPPEMDLLLRSLVSDADNYKPGYYWLRDHSNKEMNRFLRLLTINDRNEDVRAGALRLLELTKHQPSLADYDKLASSSSNLVKNAVLNCLISMGQPKHKGIIAKFLSDAEYNIRAKAEIANLRLLALTDINAAFSRIIERKLTPFKDFIEIISDKQDAINTKLLRQALVSNDNDLKKFAADALLESGQLTIEEAKTLAEDKVPALAKIGIEKLLASKEEIENKVFEALSQAYYQEAELLELQYLRTLDVKHLISNLDYYNARGYISYQALSLYHFSFIESRIRSDLENNFIKFKEESNARLKERLGDTAESIINLWREGLADSFVTSRYIAAALSGLVKNGRKSDARIARHYLINKNDDISQSSIKILLRYGNKADSKALIQLARKKYGDLKKDAAAAAVQLSPGLKGAIGELLQSDDLELVVFAIKKLSEIQVSKAGAIIEPFLSSKISSIRRTAAAYLIRILNKEDLLQLHSEYMARSSYYYDVVCMLDKALYAPGVLGEAHRRDILALLK